MIRLEGVSHQYKKNLTLENISLTIHQGEFVYVRGKSGSGKSTLLKLLYGGVQANSGEVIVANHNLLTNGKEDISRFRQQVGIVFQEFNLLNRYTVAENISYPLQIFKKKSDEIAEKVEKILGYIGLSDQRNRFPNQLSGGEQQRVAIGRALITRPKVLLADEPTGNLDWKNVKEIMTLFESLHQQGTTVVMVTHDPAIVSAFPHRSITLSRGQLVADSESDKGGLLDENA